MKVNYNKRIVIVISSPSGAGKTSVCHKLIERDKSIALSISDTTRPARDNEKDGIDYIAFTNSDYLKSDFWDIRKMDTWRNGRWTARKCKTSPHELNDATFIINTTRYNNEILTYFLGFFRISINSVSILFIVLES